MARYQIIFTTCIALIGLAMSGLWLWTEWRAWSGVMLQRRINVDEIVSSETLLGVWNRGLELEQTFLPSRHVHTPALVASHLIRQTQIPVLERAEVFLSAESAMRTALARDPADARAWARLAWFTHLRHGFSRDVLAALRMSIYLAPNDRSLVFWRISMAAPHKQSWDRDFEALMDRQIITAMGISSTRLNRIAKTTDLEEKVQSVLAKKMRNGGVQRLQDSL